MSLWVPARSVQSEWMDRRDNRAEELDAALRDLRLVNRWLGGGRSLLQSFVELLPAPAATPVRVLDVGTGGADLPLALTAAARRRGVGVEVTALELDPATARLAARHAARCPTIRVVQGDAFAPPFPPASFDFVTVSLFLHHFPHAGVVRLLRGLLGLTRRALIVNDLRRHRVPWAFIAVAARLTRRSPMFVHDAPLSVLRGFTPRELAAAARASGARRCRLRRRWPFRLVLTLEPNP